MECGVGEEGSLGGCGDREEIIGSMAGNSGDEVGGFKFEDTLWERVLELSDVREGEIAAHLERVKSFTLSCSFRGVKEGK